MENNMHVDNMENLLEKVDLYSKDELVLFEELKNQLNEVNHCFENSSSNTFDEKINDLSNKFSTISNIHNNNHMVINKNIEKYLENTIEVSKIFNKVNK